MRRTTIVGGLLAAALAIATVIHLAGGNGHRRAGTDTAGATGPVLTSDPSAVQTTDTTSSIDSSTDPVVSSSPEPPTHAALRFLDLDEGLFPATSPEKARALTESIASTGSRSALGQRAFDHQSQILAKGDLAGLTLRIAPIVTRRRDCTASTCTVDVYFLRLWSFPGRGALDDYATVEIHLITEDGQWRLKNSTVTDGPYPAGRFSTRPSGAVNAKAFEAILSGYSDAEINP